jgi:uncharacterized RDD family membrane protein YckC
MSDSTQNPPPEEFRPPPPTEGTPPADPGPGMQQPPPGQPYPNQPGYGPAYGSGGPTPTGGVGQPADLLMRFLARLIDFILVGIVNAIITSIVVVGILGLNGGGYGFGMGASFAAGAITAILTSAVSLGYFTLMESKSGQTVGKMLLKLRTQGLGGATPTTEEALKRNAWVALGILGVIPVVGGLVGGLASLAIVIVIAVTINSSPTRQGWHDNFAGGTQVIKIG